MEADIIMEYGVRPSYLLEEVEYLDNLHIGYSFYLRQKNIFGDSKTLLYAIGEDKWIRIININKL